MQKVLDNTSMNYEPKNNWPNISTYKAPDQDLYPAIFALKDAGKAIKLGDKLIMHFPDWFLALPETARAPYNKYSFQLFVDFMSKIETIEKNFDALGHAQYRDTNDGPARRKIKDATKKFLALARHLLSFYPGTHAKGDAAAKKGKGKKK